MRFSARVFLRCVSFVIIFALLLPIFSTSVLAQTPGPTAPPFPAAALPNASADVSINQHTLIQSLFLEMTLALECQLTGIDLANPTKSCLGINGKTHQIGYDPAHKDGQVAMG